MRIQLTILALVASVLVPGIADAQGARPPRVGRAHKSALRDVRWWIGEGVIIGAVALDAQSTCTAFHRGLVEGNYFGRGSTSCGKAVGILAGAGTVYTVLHLLLHRHAQGEEYAPLKFLSYVEIPVIAGGMHGWAATRNYRMPGAPACSPVVGCGQ